MMPPRKVLEKTMIMISAAINFAIVVQLQPILKIVWILRCLSRFNFHY